jgi:hypothetical protein
MVYVCSHWKPNVQMNYFMFDWSIYSLFVRNGAANVSDSFEIMIFVYVSSTWSIGELKTRFEAWIQRNDVNTASLFHFSYLIKLMAYLCSQWTTNVEMNYFMFDWSIYRIFVLNRAWKRDFLQILLFVYVFDLKHRWIKTLFETWITRNDVNGECLIHLSYLVTLMAYLCSQMSRNVHIKNFMFDWSIYRLLVLNRGGKRELFQIMICVYVCSSWSIVELIPCLQTRITGNDINGVNLFHHSYLITHMAYLCSQRTPNLKSRIFLLICRSTEPCAKQGLETGLSPNNDIRICLLDINHSWNKNAFWDVNNKKWRK